LGAATFPAHDALSSLVALTGRHASAVATGVFRDSSNGAAVLAGSHGRLAAPAVASRRREGALIDSARRAGRRAA